MIVLEYAIYNFAVLASGLSNLNLWQSGQVGEHYLASDWKQELMTLSQFLERSLGHSDAQATTRPYLAQHPLFEQV